MPSLHGRVGTELALIEEIVGLRAQLSDREKEVEGLGAENARLREFVDALDARDAECRRFHVHYIRTYDENVQLVAASDRFIRARAALSSEPQAAKRQWLHKKRGSIYVEQGRGLVQASTRPVVEGDKMVAYRNDDGDWFFREVSEFEDGRFEPLPAAEKK